jgi:hypothetical protein
MAQAILVGMIVFAAALYAAWALAPANARLGLAQRVAAWGRRSGRPRWLQRASTAVEAAARKRAGGCSDCSAVQAAPTRRPAGRPED